MKAVCLLLLLLSCTALAAPADTEEEAQAEPTAEELEQLKAKAAVIPPPAEDVETYVWFPSHEGTTKQFPSGRPITAVLGFHNGEPTPLNVSAILGSINAPNTAMAYENFPPESYFKLLHPGQQGSFEYIFRINPAIPPREFQVALTVFYHSDKAAHASTFFNQTIDVVEPKRLVDTELAFLYLLFAALLGGLGYLAYSYISKLAFVRKVQKKNKSKPRKVEQASTPGDKSEWLAGTYYTAPGAAKAKRQASGKQPVARKAQ